MASILHPAVDLAEQNLPEVEANRLCERMLRRAIARWYDLLTMNAYLQNKPSIG
jgi:hypothetical protein